MQTAARNREYTRKTEAIQDLVALRKRHTELGELDRMTLMFQELKDLQQRFPNEFAWIDWSTLTVGELIELVEIDLKILTAMISNASVTQIELESGRVSSKNSKVLESLGYLVRRTTSQKTTISWHVVEPDPTCVPPEGLKSHPTNQMTVRTAAMNYHCAGNTKEVRELIVQRQQFIELAEIDRKILTSVTTKASDTQIEVDSRELSPKNAAALVGLGYRVERLPLQKTTISWALDCPRSYFQAVSMHRDDRKS